MTRGPVQYHSTQQHRKVMIAMTAIGDSFELLETALSPSLALISAPVFLALRSGYMYVRPMVTLLPILICIDR
jgi:F0F1-type ATP synthase assembly protein I